MPDTPTYEDPEGFVDLYTIISFDQFDYTHYARDEQHILKPRLERKGYRDITFEMGEVDSFGPLSRIVRCKDKRGRSYKFFYG